MSEEVKTIEKWQGLKVNREVSYYGTGRRKNCVARVWLFPGTGKMEINERNALDYVVHRNALEVALFKPLQVTSTLKSYDVLARVSGGGIAGQVGAVVHALSRALLKLNPDFRKLLKVEGLLRRDPRMKESKKYGRKRARKGFQYRKR